MLYKATPPAEQNLVDLLEMMGTHAIHRSLDMSQPQAANDNPRNTIMVSLLQNGADYTKTAQEEQTVMLNTYERNNMFAANSATVVKPLHTPTTPAQTFSVFRANKDETVETAPVVPMYAPQDKIVDLRGNVIKFPTAMVS
jgi:hypothetical protein